MIQEEHAASLKARHAELEELVDDLEEPDLRAPSALPDWDRLPPRRSVQQFPGWSWTYL